MVVPATPEKFTEMNMETATMNPKAGECQRVPITPTTIPQIPPRMLEVWICRRSGSHHRASCT